MATRITGSTKQIDVLVALGQPSAERLAWDAGLADLAPGVAQATERLATAKEARKAAANARWLTRGAMDDADKAVTDAVRAAQHHALEASNGVKGAAAYRALFPEDLKGLVTGSVAHRELALKALAGRMGTDPGNAPMAKRLADALAARQAAVEAWKQAASNERSAVLALGAEARAFQQAWSMARYQAIVRLKDPAAARPFFPRLAGKAHAVAVTDPAGGGKPQPVPVEVLSPQAA